jgi:hypothetical protein
MARFDNLELKGAFFTLGGLIPHRAFHSSQHAPPINRAALFGVSQADRRQSGV